MDGPTSYQIPTVTTYVCRVRSLGPSLRRNSITWGINHANPIRALWKMVESILHAIVFRARRTGVARGTLMERIHYTHLHIFSDTERKHKKQMFIQLHAAMTILRSKLHSCTKTFAGHAVTNPKINDFIVFQGIGNQVKILFHFSTSSTAQVLFTHHYTWRNFSLRLLHLVNDCKIYKIYKMQKS